MIEVLVPLRKVKHQIFKVILHLRGSELIRVISKNKFQYKKQAAMAENSGWYKEGVPLRVRRMEKGLRSTEDTMGVASRSPVLNNL